MGRIIWTDHVRNEDAKYYVETNKTEIFNVTYGERKPTVLVTFYVGTAS